MRSAAVLLLFLPVLACSKSEPLAMTLRSEEPEFQSVHNTLYSNIRETQRLLSTLR